MKDSLLCYSDRTSSDAVLGADFGKSLFGGSKVEKASTPFPFHYKYTTWIGFANSNLPRKMDVPIRGDHVGAKAYGRVLSDVKEEGAARSWPSHL